MLINFQSREGFFVILDLIRQSRMQPMTMGAASSFLSHRSITGPDAKAPAHHEVPAKGDSREDGTPSPAPARRGYWARWKWWLGSG